MIYTPTMIYTPSTKRKIFSDLETSTEKKMIQNQNS
jgi:hypothetical protein